MIYGLNFNRTAIPPAFARLFRKRLKVADLKTTFHLQGVATSLDERNAMLEQANNGRRMLHSVPRHTKAHGTIFGVYVG